MGHNVRKKIFSVAQLSSANLFILQSDIICKQVLYKKRTNERPRKIKAKNRRTKLKNQGEKSLRIGPKRQRYRKQERIVKKVRKQF